MTRKAATLAALSIGLGLAAWLGATLMGAHSCSKWSPLSCGGTDPELTRLSH